MSTQGNNAISSTGSNIHDASVRCSAQSAPHKQRNSERRINAAAFERLLYWLGPDPESGGRKYEVIRNRLIMMFKARRCVFAEDLADTTFERVAGKLTQITTRFTGDPAKYFYGVAKKVFLEYQHELMAKRRRAASSLPTRTEDPNLESMLQQLDAALIAIPGTDRELILTYYTDTGRNKIRRRRALAKQFGVGPNALRLRVFRIRREIKNYILRGNPDAPPPAEIEPVMMNGKSAGRISVLQRSTRDSCNSTVVRRRSWGMADAPAMTLKSKSPEFPLASTQSRQRSIHLASAIERGERLEGHVPGL